MFQGSAPGREAAATTPAAKRAGLGVVIRMTVTVLAAVLAT